MKKVSARSVAIAVTVVALFCFALPSSAQVAAPAITRPAEGSLQASVAPAKVAIAGTAVPGSSVEVYDTLPVVTSLGTTTTNANGNWQLQVAMGDGEHAINAVASSNGEVSPPSSLRSFTVDAVRPTVAITSPQNSHVFEPGDTVEIRGTASDARGVHAIRLEYWLLNQLVAARLAECTGCDDGDTVTWSHEPTLQSGAYRVKAWAFDTAGNASIVGQVDFTNMSGETPFSMPDVPGVPEVVPPQILGPGDGSTQPGASEPVPFSGTTEPGSRVSFYEEVAGLGKIGTAVDDDEDGAWHFSFRFPTGTYGIRAKARDSEGNVSELSELIVFTVDGDRPVLDVPEGALLFSPLDPVVLTGTVTDRQATWMVVLEYWVGDDMVLRDAARCARCGRRSATWSHRPDLPLPGYYHVRVLSFDRAGNPAYEDKITFVSTNV